MLETSQPLSQRNPASVTALVWSLRRGRLLLLLLLWLATMLSSSVKQSLYHALNMHQPRSTMTWRGLARVSPLTNPLNFITLLQTLRGKSNCRRRTVLCAQRTNSDRRELQWSDVTCGHDCRAVCAISQQIILKYDDDWYLPINNRKAGANKNDDDCVLALWSTAKYQGLPFLCSL